MDVLIAIVLAVAFTAVFRVPLKRWPWVFYALPLVLDLLLVAGRVVDLPVLLWRSVMAFHARCLFAFGLFAVVMYIGVLRDGSRLKAALLPIRAELSIVASILTAGHVVNLLGSYVGRALGGNLGSLLPGFVVALVLVALLVPLAVTSVKAVKRRMPADAWKHLQRFAYLFWGLLFAHVVLVLGQSAASGAASAQSSLVVYAAVFSVYLVLRVARYAFDRRARRATAAEAPSPGL